MKTIASTKIQCTSGKRHAVRLLADGSLTCDCADGAERGGMLAGRIMLGLSAVDGARGCGALIALAQGATSLVQLVRGTKNPDYGLWHELVHAYGKNPVFVAALDRAERADPLRATTRQLLLESTERAGYHCTLGKRRFRDEFRAFWDVGEEELGNFVVSTFDDDPWGVPYAPDWKEQIADKGLAVIDGKLVCGRSSEDSTIFYAVTPHERHSAHWVRPHRMVRGKKLKEIVA